MKPSPLSEEQKAILQRFFESSAEVRADFGDDASWARFEQAWDALELLERETQANVCHVGVPRLTPHFTGRNEEIRAISERVTVQNTLAVTGSNYSGGIGKTSLVQAFIEDDLNPFETVLWTDITPSPEISTILRTWAEQLNHSADLNAGMSLDEMMRKMREILNEKINDACGGSALIVLDDVWENGLELVEIIKNISPHGTKFLITTRHESVASQFDEAVSLDLLAEEDSANLLRNFLTHIENVTPLIDELLDIVTHHPLTIELTGAVIAQQPEAANIRTLIKSWKNELDTYTPSILWSEDSDVPASLDLVLRDIYQLLPEHTRIMFRALGVIAPELSWDLSLMSKLLPAMSEEAINESLEILIRYHLVRVDKRDSQKLNWYRQHALIHQYASAQLAKEKQTLEVFELYSEAVIEHVVYLQNHEMPDWKRITPYLPHIHHVGDELLHLYERSVKLAKHADTFARHMTSYLEIYRNLRRREWLEMGLKANRIISRHQEAVYQANIAMDYATHAEYDLARDYYEQAIASFRELNDALELAKHINSLGFVYRHKGELDLAYQHFMEALQFGEKTGDDKVLSSIFNNLGGYHSQRKEYKKALAYYRRALEAAQDGQEILQQSTALNNIAHVLIQEESYTEAIQYLKDSLELTKDFENLSSRAATLSNLGKVQFKLQHYEEAVAYYLQALEIDEASEDWWGKVFSFSNLGQVYAEMNKRDVALDYYRKALIAAEKVGREDFVQRIKNSIDNLLPN